MGWINGFEPNSHCLWFQNAIKGQEIYYSLCLKAHNIIILWWWKTIQLKPWVHIYPCLKVPVGLANLTQNVLLGNRWYCPLTYWITTRKPSKKISTIFFQSIQRKYFIIVSSHEILKLQNSIRTSWKKDKTETTLSGFQTLQNYINSIVQEYLLCLSFCSFIFFSRITRKKIYKYIYIYINIYSSIKVSFHLSFLEEKKKIYFVPLISLLFKHLRHQFQQKYSLILISAC